MEKQKMKQGETKAECCKAYQMYCSRMEKQLKAAEGDIQKCLGIAFELWAATFRITSDLSMQMEHISQFVEVYGKIMPEKEQALYKDMQQEISQAHEHAEQVSKRQEQKMAGMMQKVFSKEQNAKDFFGGEDAYESMRILWNSGELMDKLKEIIFVDENAGGNVEYILQKIG